MNLTRVGDMQEKMEKAQGRKCSQAERDREGVESKVPKFYRMDELERIQKGKKVKKKCRERERERREGEAREDSKKEKDDVNSFCHEDYYMMSSTYIRTRWQVYIKKEREMYREGEREREIT